MPRTTAATVVASGEAFRQREAITGEPLPATCPQIAAAFAAGLLDPEVAAAMRRTLGKCAPGLAPWELDRLERQLIDTASEGWTPDDLLGWLKRVPEHANPNGGEPDPSEPAPVATVKRRELRNGLVRWVLDLDTLTDGFLRTAVDADTAERRPILVTPDQDDAAETQDRRPLEQQDVDSLRLVAKEALKIDDGHVAGTAVALLATMTEEALRTGLGTAELPDCGTRISASVARMLAADAEIIPVVLGGASQPLDLGTGRRFVSEARRLVRRPRLRRTTVVVRRGAHRTRRTRTRIDRRRSAALLAVPPAARRTRMAARAGERQVVVDATTPGRPHRRKRPGGRIPPVTTAA